MLTIVTAQWAAENIKGQLKSKQRLCLSMCHPHCACIYRSVLETNKSQHNGFWYLFKLTRFGLFVRPSSGHKIYVITGSYTM